MNPFISFSVYVAARVFVQYLKTHANGKALGDPDVLIFLSLVLTNIGKGMSSVITHPEISPFPSLFVECLLIYTIPRFIIEHSLGSCQ